MNDVFDMATVVSGEAAAVLQETGSEHVRLP